MIIITLGDPWSVNAECVARVLSARGKSLASGGNPPVVLVGSRWHWDSQTCQAANLPAPQAITSLDNLSTPGLYFLDIGQPSLNRPADALSPLERGRLAVAALSVIPKARQYPDLAVLTSPIDKKACSLAGFVHHGHTEFFEHHWKSPAIMLLAGPKLRVGLVTNHASIRDVPGLITPDLIKSKLRLLARTLRDDLGIERPRIAVCGLNPHCGDNGLFGDEDQRITAPAIDLAGKELSTEIPCDIAGPIPADTAFFRAMNGLYDGVLAMYHDQGLGPLKTVHFDDAVNISGGLPHLRVSPDHGPASDLYGTGRASTKSFEAALDLCIQHLHRRSPGGR